MDKFSFKMTGLYMCSYDAHRVADSTNLDSDTIVGVHVGIQSMTFSKQHQFKK